MRSRFGRGNSDKEGDDRQRELSAGSITRVAQQKHDPERVGVFIDDEFAFGLTLEIAIREGLKKGVELSIEAQQALLNDEEGHRARAVALNYVDYQARTVEEVRRKLCKKGYNDVDSEDAIQYLLGYGFLDDEAYAKSYVRGRFAGSGYGPRRLRAELIRKGVSSSIIANALTELVKEVDLESKARQLAHRRWESLSREPDIRKRKKKLFDYLVRRGFDYHIVSRIVDESR